MPAHFASKIVQRCLVGCQSIHPHIHRHPALHHSPGLGLFQQEPILLQQPVRQACPVNGIAERHQRFPVSRGPLMKVNDHIQFSPNRLTANLAVIGQTGKSRPPVDGVDGEHGFLPTEFLRVAETDALVEHFARHLGRGVLDLVPRATVIGVRRLEGFWSLEVDGYDNFPGLSGTSMYWAERSMAGENFRKVLAMS